MVGLLIVQIFVGLEFPGATRGWLLSGGNDFLNFANRAISAFEKTEPRNRILGWITSNQ
jgi:hypothetical protein